MQERIDIVVSERGARTVTRNIRNIGTTAKKSQGSVQLLSRALGLLGGALVLTSAIRTMADFSQAMSTVKAISEATEEQFISLSEAAQNLGATTRFTATQAAEGMIFLARTGFTANEVLATITDTLKLAQAGALELGRAADIASNVLKGFGLEVEQMGRVVDVLAKTANSANTTVEQLGDAMSFAAPAAKAIGVEVELAAAAIGVLGDAAIPASRAGTGLRQIFIKLLDPTSKAKKAIEGMGISVDDVNIQARGLIPVLELLREKNIGLSEAAALVGVRQATALLILKDSVGKLKELNQENINAAGTANRVATVMDDNLNGALLRVRSAFESIILSLGQAGGEGSLRTILERIATLFRLIAANADILATALAALAAVITVKLVQGALILLLGSLKKLGIALLALSSRALPLLASAAIASFSIMAAMAAANGKSIEDTFNELKTNVLGIFSEIIEPVSTINEFENSIGKLSTEIKELGGFSALSKEQMTSFIDRIKDLKSEIGQRLLLQEFIAPGSQAVEEMTDQVRVLDKALALLKDNLSGAGGQLKIVVTPPEEIAKTSAELRDLRVALLETKTDLASGFERGLLKVARDFEDFATLAENSVVNAFQSMEDALVKFVQTGKLDFKSLADSIIADLIRIQIRAQITGPLSKMLSNFFSPSAGSSISAITPGASAAGAGTPFATGGMVSGPGGPTDDLVNARLSNGEFVVNALSASKFLPLLQAINDNTLSSSAPPASMGGGSARAGGGVVVQVFDQRTNGDAEPVEVQESITGDGRKQIAITIRDTVKRQITSGQFDGAMRERFNSQPKLVRRT